MASKRPSVWPIARKPPAGARRARRGAAAGPQDKLTLGSGTEQIDL